MRSRFLLSAVVGLSVTLVPRAGASQINPLDLSALAGKAEAIVLGQVEGVKRLDADRDEITVRIADVLKGKTADKTVTFPITCRGGLKDFDPELKVGDKGLFFLQAIEEGKSRLAFFGSVAIFPKGGNFRVAGR
ncbi:MAG: hypothetical protein J2P46_20570 [Zavarzinella sp.]|nr:hypothetical protein [Zavarzinella sp.]